MQMANANLNGEAINTSEIISDRIEFDRTHMYPAKSSRTVAGCMVRQYERIDVNVNVNKNRNWKVQGHDTTAPSPNCFHRHGEGALPAPARSGHDNA